LVPPGKQWPLRPPARSGNIAARSRKGGIGMNLTCYRIHEDAPELIPARATRAWMDATASRFT
jgi:hypothetical protein